MNESMKYPIEKISLNLLESIDSIPVACDNLFGNNFENHDVVDCEFLKYHLFDEYAFDMKNFLCEYDHAYVCKENVSFKKNHDLDESLYELDYELAISEDENSLLDSFIYIDESIESDTKKNLTSSKTFM